MYHSNKAVATTNRFSTQFSSHLLLYYYSRQDHFWVSNAVIVLVYYFFLFLSSQLKRSKHINVFHINNCLFLFLIYVRVSVNIISIFIFPYAMCICNWISALISVCLFAFFFSRTFDCSVCLHVCMTFQLYFTLWMKTNTRYDLINSCINIYYMYSPLFAHSYNTTLTTPFARPIRAREVRYFFFVVVVVVIALKSHV